MTTPSSAPVAVSPDRGWGLLATAAGILLGFLVSFLVVLPWFPKDGGTWNLTMMTAVVTAAMTLGGAAGYLLVHGRTG
jgi:hypothetical protein